jgi:hypothetical protein
VTEPQRTRRRFWKQALLVGVRWSNSVVGAAFNLLAALALLGLATADVLPTVWYPVAAFFVVVLLAGLGEGAYEVWEQSDIALGAAQARLDRRAARQETLDWLGVQLDLGSSLMKRLERASLGEAERISEEFVIWDETAEALMRERLPEYAPEYTAPVLSPEDRRKSDSWRESAHRHWQLRLERLLSIREQIRLGHE